MSKKVTFEILDVFTNKPFRGNQLAVFPAPRGLTKNRMQSIAGEIHFSETAFIFPPKDQEADALVRIFTPSCEIPFAGHPSIGSAYVIAEGAAGGKKGPPRVVLQLGIGLVPVDIAYSGKKIKTLTMHQPIPRFGSALQNRGQAARALGIRILDVLGGGVVSNGMDFLVVEAVSSEAVAGAVLNLDELVRIIKRHNVSALSLFARLNEAGTSIHTRCFAPTLDVIEDPATGSAAGALGGYLARILKFPRRLKLKLQQGAEIGRPSAIGVDVNCDRGMIQGVAVSGGAARVGEGAIYL
ncbi:MAG TPA: PhzF family phenazine biosynthesis protein [Candidatus Eisenbacteria bacterium]|uniref:PhzF family phenazine biosynthesis protein n=1 Tax=Eiseniibacteriota bacterium TaxID=2212470 RepID=A0A7V2AUJ1_UNCEI|nr:PhzF family phenazine biosynthesis protein [Candidatus Eisenbacteria bacterium]